MHLSTGGAGGVLANSIGPVAVEAHHGPMALLRLGVYSSLSCLPFPELSSRLVPDLSISSAGTRRRLRGRKRRWRVRPYWSAPSPLSPPLHLPTQSPLSSPQERIVGSSSSSLVTPGPCASSIVSYGALRAHGCTTDPEQQRRSPKLDEKSPPW